MATVLVTGGTGVLGREVVAALNESGTRPRILSRRLGSGLGGDAVLGNLVTGEGLSEALSGVDVVVHCASDPRNTQVDTDGTRNLLEKARDSGSPHVVYVSIVGIDRIPYSYYQAKLAAETYVAESGLPWTILRATQFHDFVAAMLAMLTRSPLVPVPARATAQPVDTREVADQVAALALGEPAGRASDMGGPQVESVDAMARAYLDAVGLRRRRVQAVPAWGKMLRAFQAGEGLVREGRLGSRTFQQFLRERARPGGGVDTGY